MKQSRDQATGATETALAHRLVDKKFDEVEDLILVFEQLQELLTWCGCKGI
jgi:hypothetical protein